MGTVVKGDFNRKKENQAQQSSAGGPIPGYQLKIGVAFSDPLIWRIVRVPGNMTLAGLHKTIQTCMGWQDIDGHQFLVGKIFYQPGFGIEQMERQVKYDEALFELHQLEEGMQFLFTYLYDAGDGWELEIAVEEIIETGHEQPYPILTSGNRACPPEDYGDIHAYQAKLAAYEASVDNEGGKIFPEYPEFEPECCDCTVINEGLKKLIIQK